MAEQSFIKFANTCDIDYSPKRSNQVKKNFKLGYLVVYNAMSIKRIIKSNRTNAEVTTINYIDTYIIQSRQYLVAIVQFFVKNIFMLLKTYCCDIFRVYACAMN